VVDLEINEKKKLRDGNTLTLIKEGEEWMFKYGAQKIIPIIELKPIMSLLKKSIITDIACTVEYDDSKN